MTGLLVIGALFLFVVAVPFTSQVSAGPTIMGGAAVLAILARIQQAREQYLGFGKPIVGLRCVHCGHQNPLGPATCEKCGGNLKGGGSVGISA